MLRRPAAGARSSSPSSRVPFIYMLVVVLHHFINVWFGPQRIVHAFIPRGNPVHVITQVEAAPRRAGAADRDGRVVEGRGTALSS
jgi:hypothetical protein